MALYFASSTVFGTKIRAGIPESRATCATAFP
jgi:hypothetical protein